MGNPSDPSRIIHDLLEAIGVSPRIVNVGADPDMHLGLPQTQDGADVPHLYIKATPLGGAAHVLECAQNVELAKAMTAARIPFDAEAAAALQSNG